MSKHHYHIVQKGDTLQSVAKQYNTTAEELRSHHNKYCPLPNLLNLEIEYQKELIVPKHKKERTIEEVPQ